MFKVLAYYTQNTQYENEVHDFMDCLIKLNLEYRIIPVPTRKDWVQNLRIKPHLIMDALEQFPNHDILYTDIDSRVMRYPKLFDNFDGDIGFHIFKGKPAAGTIFIKNSENGKLFIKEWIHQQDLNPTQWDQGMLNNAYNIMLDKVNIIDLPPEYAKIFDLMANVKNPVIEHFQASRRYKKSINEYDLTLTGCAIKIPVEMPKQLFKMKVRDNGDGTFSLPRISKSQDTEMQKKYVRFPNELRWYAISEEPSMVMEDFINIFKNKGCYFVGKGPSLDILSSKDFRNQEWPIMCINESIHQVEKLDLLNPIFVVQQDNVLGNTCKPEKGIIFCSFACSRHYIGFKNKCIYYPERLNCGRGSLTILTAMGIAEQLGCIKFHLLCFDSCITKDVEYASCIGYSPENAGNPKRFLTHRGKIEKFLAKIPKHFIPVNPD